MKRVLQGGPYPLVRAPVATGPHHPVTAAFLQARYWGFERELAFPDSSDGNEWETWRATLRRRLREVLCLEAWGPPLTPTVTVLERAESQEYERRTIAYETLEGNWTTAYLLVPRGLRGPAPAALCVHGHGMDGKEGVVDPRKARGVAWGHELARGGTVVLAPDSAGMGARDESPPAGEEGLSVGCDLLFRRLTHMGLDLTGLRVFELMVALNLLAKLPEVDPRRIGCAGLSGGCWLSQVLAALDERIRAVILSGFFSTFVQTTWIGHCVCHHPHGIGRICDMPDLSALIAPRPQFVESGLRDRWYPAEPAYSMVRRAYALLGVPERLAADFYDGGHEFHGARSIPWLVERLSTLPAD